MASKFQSLKDEEIVRVAKGKVIMSAAATYTEVEIDTQLSIERGVIWLIAALEIFVDSLPSKIVEVGAEGGEKVQVHVARESKTAILDPDDADVLIRHDHQLSRSAAIGTDAGPLWVLTTQPNVFHYTPPLPYAAMSLYFGVNSTSATAVTAYLRARYTIRSVSDKYFFRVAQALLG